MPSVFAQPTLVTLPDQRRLEIIRHGDPTHQPVLFHHGYASSGLSIPPNAELLAQLELQILAPNRPGSGNSDVHRHLTLESFAEDVFFALDALGIRGPLPVLGWSAGGLYAQAQAALYISRVTALHLLSTCLPLGEPETYRALPPRWKTIKFLNDYAAGLAKPVFRRLSQQWTREPDRMIDRFMNMLGPAEQEEAGNPVSRMVLRDAAQHAFTHQGQGVYYDGQALCRRPEFTLAAIRAPTTIWHGTADFIWHPAPIHYLSTRLPHATLRMLPDEGHMLFLRYWRQILQQVRSELS
ncbi:alpha/beta fold hydrolase [Hymenobacter cellulosivorans]|uniref:Alpha/beta hydrolase n=1 Tax=Hymenobacter cellulosivorans TaxID=2932249 RepID=A0ABY4F351_9BACT|nr:alpha/beta fold hydrolase [Hymenobacter cellulosivorans]UOQ50985.1 alpha/beta hydrolase [Hymenobacter cellulosivorans]